MFVYFYYNINKQDYIIFLEYNDAIEKDFELNTTNIFHLSVPFLCYFVPITISSFFLHLTNEKIIHFIQLWIKCDRMSFVKN